MSRSRIWLLVAFVTALALPHASARAQAPVPTAAEVRERFDAEDYDGALELSERRIAAARSGALPKDDLCPILSSYGAILNAAARDDEAIEALIEAVAACDKLSPPNPDASDRALYNLAMVEYLAGKAEASMPRFERLFTQRIARLGKDELGLFQKYDTEAVQALTGFANASVEAGRSDQAADLLLQHLEGVNIALNDNAVRADFLEAVVDLFEARNEMARIDVTEFASFVSRSGALDEVDGPDVFRQYEALRVVYEAAGETEKAELVALGNPEWIEGRFRELYEDYRDDEALALLRKATDHVFETCEVICSDQEGTLRVLELAYDEGWELLSPEDKVTLLNRLARVSTKFEGDFAASGREWYEALAELQDQLGHPGEAQAARIHAAIAEPDADIKELLEGTYSNGLALTYARRLREAGLVAEADKVVASEMECGFKPAFDGDDRFEPCKSAMLAMREYSVQLERSGRRPEAEFFRLPFAVVRAFETRDSEEANKGAERLITLGQRLFAPEDPYFHMAMGVYAGATRWYDRPLFDIPKAYRLCGRWDEPVPQVERQVDSGAIPMPMVSVAAPSRESFYFPNDHFTAEDPRHVFFNGLVGGRFGAYALQCLGQGREQDGIKFADWALGEAERLGYPISDRESVYSAKAQIQRSAGDFNGAEASYLTVVNAYLTGKDKSRNIFDPHKALTDLIGLYSEVGRAERLELVINQMIQSGQFGGGTFDSPSKMRPLMEVLFELYVAKGDIDNSARLLANLSPDYDPALEASAGDLDEKQLLLVRREAQSAFARRLASLQLANGDESDALETLDQAIAANDAALKAVFGSPTDPDEIGQLENRRTALSGTLFAQIMRVKVEREDYLGALDMVKQTGILTLAGRMTEMLAQVPNLPVSEDGRWMVGELGSDDVALLSSLRGGVAGAAEMALRAGDIEQAKQYMALIRRYPAPANANIIDRQFAWTSVALGVLDPSLREDARREARGLADGLEREWRVATRSPLDASYVQYALAAAPAYFGDIAALYWTDRQAGTASAAEDTTVFGYVQRALVSKTDLSIANSIGRALLQKNRPELFALLEERDLIATSLFRTEKVEVGYNSVTFGEKDEESGEDAGLRAQGNSASRMRTIDERLQREAPEYFELTSSEPLPLDQARALLRPDEAVLLLAPGRFGTQVIALTSDGMEWRQAALTLEQMDTAVRRLRFFAGADVTLSASESRTWLTEVDGGINGYDRDTAHRLYAELVEPFLPALAGRKHLYIAGGGPLTALPFSLLVSQVAEGRDDDPAALRATRWLGDDFALTQIPSLQSFALLRRNAGLDAVDEQSFLGFGDPVLDGDAMRRGARRSGGGGAPVEAMWRRKGANKVIDIERIRSLARLPGTSEELNEIAGALDAPLSSLRLGADATETNLKAAPLAQAGVLALATHGIMAGEIPGAEEPGLILTPPITPSAQDDGYLSASEVAQLTLHADWVILSACNTAGGDGEPGSPALSGLAKAFFYAGARGLLVSHWPVRDDAAAKLTVAAIRARKDEPSLSRAEALQKAMKLIRDDPRADGFVDDEFGNPVQQSWAHPSAWAPFTLVGDAR